MSHEGGRRSPLAASKHFFSRFRKNKAGIHVPDQPDHAEKMLQKLMLSQGRAPRLGKSYMYRRATKRPAGAVRAENRKRNKAARKARRANRV